MGRVPTRLRGRMTDRPPCAARRRKDSTDVSIAGFAELAY